MRRLNASLIQIVNLLLKTFNMDKKQLLKDVLPTGMNEIKIKKVLQPKEGQYGMFATCFVEWNGEEYMHFLNEKELNFFHGGETAFAIKDSKGVKIHSNNTQKKSEVKADPLPDDAWKQAEQNLVVEQKQDIQDRIIRGMCFNNTCVLLAGVPNAEDFVLIKSQRLYEEMNGWLQGND